MIYILYIILYAIISVLYGAILFKHSCLKSDPLNRNIEELLNVSTLSGILWPLSLMIAIFGILYEVLDSIIIIHKLQ